MWQRHTTSNWMEIGHAFHGAVCTGHWTRTPYTYEQEMMDKAIPKQKIQGTAHTPVRLQRDLWNGEANRAQAFEKTTSQTKHKWRLRMDPCNDHRNPTNAEVNKGTSWLLKDCLLPCRKLPIVLPIGHHMCPCMVLWTSPCHTTCAERPTFPRKQSRNPDVQSLLSYMHRGKASKMILNILYIINWTCPWLSAHITATEVYLHGETYSPEEDMEL